MRIRKRLLGWSCATALLLTAAVPQQSQGVRDWSALSFASGLSIRDTQPPQLRVWSVVRNTGPRTVRVAYGSSALHVWLWHDAARTAAPIWRSELRRPVAPKGTKPAYYVYPAVLYMGKLAPNDTLSFREDVPVDEIFQDVPDGRYWATVELTLIDDSILTDDRNRRYTFAGDRIIIADGRLRIVP